MRGALLVVAFGVAGILARYSIVTVIAKHFPHFPAGTLTVNIVGSFLAGALFTFFLQTANYSPEIRIAIISGFLGGFTTFSSFSLEMIQFFQAGEYAKLMLYGVGSPVLGFVFALSGMWLVKS